MTALRSLSPASDATSLMGSQSASKRRSLPPVPTITVTSGCLDLRNDLPSAIKRSCPPGHAVITTISGPAIEVPFDEEEYRCSKRRERYPEVEAIVGLLFRFIAVCLHIALFTISHILYTEHDWKPARIVNRIIEYCIMLDLIEIIALLNPLTLIPRIRLGPIQYNGFRVTRLKVKNFPRLPSFWLALAETAALGMMSWNIYILLNPPIPSDEDVTRQDCPKMTCVMPVEQLCIYGFIIQVMAKIVHLGFCLMAWVHYVKRKLPVWQDWWEL